jgi:integrase/recombinase XerD
MNIVSAKPNQVNFTDSSRFMELVDSFIASLDIKQSSRDLYKRTLRQYINWINKVGYTLSEITKTQVIEYKEQLFKSGLSSLTVSSYINSVRRLYEWTEANRLYPNVAKGVKSPKRKQQFKKQPLQPNQANSLLDSLKTNQRDYAIINLLLRTGLRTKELTNTNIEDIVYKGSQRVLLVKGKGRDEKDNFVVLTDKAYKPLEEYLATRGKTSLMAPLFVSESNNNKGGRITTRTVSKIAKEGLKSIGLNEKSFTAHSLRHTTAVNILRAGGSLEIAQLTLRHSNPATTQIYTATLNEERRLQNSGEALIDLMF